MPASTLNYATASEGDAGRFDGPVPDQSLPTSPTSNHCGSNGVALDRPQDAPCRIGQLNLSHLGDLSVLRSLDLQGQGLRSLPPALFGLSALEELNLNHNRLGRLDGAISELANLRELLLAGNQLECLPQSIGKLRRLSVLDVSSNRLTFLPAEIAGLGNLRKLWCDDNRFGAGPPRPRGRRETGGEVWELERSRREPGTAAVEVTAAGGGSEEVAEGSQVPHSPDDFAPRRESRVLRLGEIAIQTAALAIARDEHSYCSQGVRCAPRPAHTAPGQTSPPRARFAPRDGQPADIRSPEENRGLPQAVAGSPDHETESGKMCRLDLIPPLLRPRLRRSRTPGSCSRCSRPVYHGGIFLSGMIVKCSKVVTVAYVLCSYGCRAASHRR